MSPDQRAIRISVRWTAEVNLTAFEAFFNDGRPFLLEGA